MQTNHSFARVVEVTRGPHVESAHRGAIAVVDSRGRLIASLGNPKEPAYLRSAAKPFQALAFICSGAADQFGATEEELAVVCGSHSGEPRHIELVTSLLQKTGVRSDELQCGLHPPFDAAARRDLVRAGTEPTVLHNNCSAKHIAMIATARFLGISTEDYTDPDHDVQMAIRGILGFLAGFDADEIGMAVDGCAVPSFRLPLRGFALAMARLAAAGEQTPPPVTGPPGEAVQSEEEDLDDLYEDEARAADEVENGEEEFPVPVYEAMTRVWTAMRNHPVLTAGSRGRICTDLMRVAGSFEIPLVAKSGAEGVYAMGVVHLDQAYGIALKVEDGSERARNATALETLFQLGFLPEEAEAQIVDYHRPLVLTRRNEPAGEVRPRFQLNRGLPA